jgi:hypothetical protein
MDWDKLVLEKTISNLQYRIAKATERGERHKRPPKTFESQFIRKVKGGSYSGTRKLREKAPGIDV